MPGTQPKEKFNKKCKYIMLTWPFGNPTACLHATGWICALYVGARCCQRQKKALPQMGQLFRGNSLACIGWQAPVLNRMYPSPVRPSLPLSRRPSLYANMLATPASEFSSSFCPFVARFQHLSYSRLDPRRWTNRILHLNDKTIDKYFITCVLLVGSTLTSKRVSLE